jgi:hypothetical protein
MVAQKREPLEVSQSNVAFHARVPQPRVISSYTSNFTPWASGSWAP